MAMVLMLGVALGHGCRDTPAGEGLKKVFVLDTYVAFHVTAHGYIQRTGECRYAGTTARNLFV